MDFYIHYRTAWLSYMSSKQILSTPLSSSLTMSITLLSDLEHLSRQGYYMLTEVLKLLLSLLNG